MYETILFTLAGLGILFLLLIYGMLQTLFGEASSDTKQRGETQDPPAKRESKAPHLLLLLPLVLIIWLFRDEEQGKENQ